MALLRWQTTGIPRWAWVAIVSTIVLSSIAAAASWQALWSKAAAPPHFVEVSDGVYILPRPDALASFRLIKHDNTPFDNASLTGRWSFMIFGYTSCPDFCPTTLSVFTQVHGLLTQQPDVMRDLQFVMVSVDPARDTPALLKDYVLQFHREFVGVTGDPGVIARLADSVGAVYSKVPGADERNYLIDHSTAVLLINPQGQLQGIFAGPHSAKTMASGFLAIRERARAL